MAAHSYHEQVDIANTRKLRELMQDLPGFVFSFFRGIEPTTSSRTRIAYAYDLHVFFEFLTTRHPYFTGKTKESIVVQDLDLGIDLFEGSAVDNCHFFPGVDVCLAADTQFHCLKSPSF